MKQTQKSKKRNKTTKLRKATWAYRDFNFFNEDISWASIVAVLLNTSWDTLLTVVKTDEMYKININICQEISKKHVMATKSPRKHQIKGDGRASKRKNIKITKENTEVSKSSKQRKCTKSDQRNWKQLKNFNKYRKKSKRNESYCCYQK